MRQSLRVLTFLAALTPALFSRAESPTNLAKGLEPLRPFLGKTWKGQFKGPKMENAPYDVMKWERALNGQAIRILHSVNRGEYGGETLITWNPKKDRLEFYYFTTAGYMTRGSVTLEPGKIITHEEVLGNQEGVTEVKATMELLPNSRLHTKALYLKKGEWVDGHEITYQEAPDATVEFK